MRVATLVVSLLGVGCGAKTGLDDCPGRAEECNGLDDDCDGAVDDGLTCFFLDGELIEAFGGEACGADWYSYDEPDLESANPTPDIRRSDQVVVGAQWNPSCAGSNVGMIADLPMDGSGGSLRVDWRVSPPESAGLIVSDEPDECFHDDTSGIGGCRFRWNLCCTDGFLLGPWTTDGCVTMTITRVDDPERGPGVMALDVLDGTDRDIPREFGAPFEICAQIREPVD